MLSKATKIHGYLELSALVYLQFQQARDVTYTGTKLFPQDSTLHAIEFIPKGDIKGNYFI